MTKAVEMKCAKVFALLNLMVLQHGNMGQWEVIKDRKFIKYTESEGLTLIT